MSVLSDFLAGVKSTASKAKAGAKKVNSYIPKAGDFVNSPQNIPVLTPQSLKSGTKKIVNVVKQAELRGFTPEQIRTVTPTLKEGAKGLTRSIAEIPSGLGYLTSFIGAQKQADIANTKLGGTLADIGAKISEYSIPKTPGEAKTMIGFDIATLPFMAAKTASIPSALSKANTPAKVAKITKGLDLSEDVISALAKETDQVKISNILNTGIEDSNFRRSVAAGLSQRAAQVDKEIAAMERAGVFPKANGPLEKLYVEKADLPLMMKNLDNMDKDGVFEVNKFLNTRNIDAFKINEQGIASGSLPGRIEVPKADPLLQEARKYKSAEEFVKAQSKFFHGGSDVSSGVELGKSKYAKTFFVSDNSEYAKGYGGKNSVLNSVYVDPSAKLIDIKNASQSEIEAIRKKIQEIKDAYIPYSDVGGFNPTFGNSVDDLIDGAIRGKSHYAEDPALVDVYKKLGYDGMVSYEDVGMRGKNVGVWNKNKIQTQSQLADLWKKAQGGKTLKGFVGGGKLPEDAPAKRMANFLEGIKNAKSKDAVKKEKDILSRKLAGEVKKDGFLSKLSAGLNPKGKLDEISQKIYEKWARGSIVAKELANSAIKKLSIPEKDELKTIFDYQAGKANKYTESIREAFDGIFKEANDRLAKFGKSFEYQKNYLPQVYKNSPEEIKDAMASYMKSKGVDDMTITKYLFDGKKLDAGVAKTLKLNPSFIREKAFPDYATAMKHGLTPRFTHPAQLFAYYRGELEKTINNLEFLDSLQKEGRVVAIKQDGLRPIVGPDFLEGYYAKPELARLLNNLFKSDADKGILDSIISGVAFASRKMQEIALSGGIPRTSFNFFTIGQTIKEMTSGNFKPIVAFVRSNFDVATLRYFEKNADVLQAMARNGINLGDRVGSYETVYDNLAQKFSVGRVPEILGEQFDKAFNKKTFASFMPQMYTQVFKDAMNKGLKKGMTQAESETFAGDVTKAAFGLFEDVGRSKGTEDALSATFFAPKFREGIIRTLGNAVKSVTTEIRNPAFYKNRRLVAGMALTYAGYNALNYKLNGHYMWDNPSGKEFDLMIPTKNKNEDVIFIGFMPSFLAFARNMASGVIATGKGDFNMATQKFGGLLSMPLKITSEVLSNSDYFGRQIYKDTDSGTAKLQKIATYVGLAVNHPAVKAIWEYISDKSPLYQAVSKGIELPFKFSTMPKIYRQQFYEAMDKQEVIRAKERDAFKPKYEELFKQYENNPQEALKSYNALSDSEKEMFKSLKSSEKRKNTQSIKEKVFPIVKESTALYKAGKKKEAMDMYNALSKEEKKVFTSVKKSAGL